jgi:hypothetical protein
VEKVEKKKGGSLSRKLSMRFTKRQPSMRSKERWPAAVRPKNKLQRDLPPLHLHPRARSFHPIEVHPREVPGQEQGQGLDQDKDQEREQEPRTEQASEALHGASGIKSS